jgi:hypothetical protein
MKVPSFLSPFIDGDSPKRLLQGLVVGVVATLVIGFNWGGWQLGSTTRDMVETASQDATVAALAPICAEKFERAANADGSLVTELGALNSWDRDNHLIKAGWVTFAGDAQPDDNVAVACASLLSKTLSLK